MIGHNKHKYIRVNGAMGMLQLDTGEGRSICENIWNVLPSGSEGDTPTCTRNMGDH